MSVSLEPGCRTYCFGSDLTCEPLKTLHDIQLFLQEPPVWRTLCQPLIPHSSYVSNSKQVDHSCGNTTLENTINFCHVETECDKTPPRFNEEQLPKLLVCHDMANGYHEDSVIDGTGNYDAYTFYNWAAVDIFCYFSHHLVTIPPLGWINAAHAHGVKVIGTFITEWGEGVSFWNTVFTADDAGSEYLVSALVTIAKTLKFEGWLINIENKISEPQKLLKFVQSLTSVLHQEIPDGVVIWYDSVTIEGNLSWQNRLNEKNRPFFDACDGIFTNYSWGESDIIMSVGAAGGRVRDVYVGIDVWGRNFYGGGMFNTQAAVKLVHKHGCSMAVFAPAWTHEAMGAEGDTCDPNAVANAEDLPKIERFFIRDRALWGSLWPYLKTRLPTSLPFKTSFCRGLGHKRRMYGEVLCNNPWYNLRHMQYQPNSAHGCHGYILSTQDKIDTVSRQMLTGQSSLTKGSIRNSLMQLNKMTKEEKEYEEEKQTQNDITDVGNSHTKHTNDDDIDHDDDSKFSEHKSSVEDVHESKLHKLKNVFKSLFRIKRVTERRESEHKVQMPETSQRDSNEIALHTPDHSSSLIVSTGRSLINTSVHIKLGQSKTRYSVAYIPDERQCIETWLDDSFIGGTCLRINPSDNDGDEHRTIRLLQCDFVVKSREKLVVCMVTKMVRGFKQSLNMWLYATNYIGETKMELVGQHKHLIEDPSSSYEFKYFPLSEDSEQFEDLQSFLLLKQPDFYLSPANSFGWQVMYYELPMTAETRVTSINLRTEFNRGGILLGHVGLCTRPA